METVPALEAVDNRFNELLRNSTLVDLTHTLDEAYPLCATTAPQFKHVVHNWYEPRPDDPQRLLSRSYTQISQDGRETHGVYYSCWFTLFEHAGTHFDAPSHAIPPSGSHAGSRPPSADAPMPTCACRRRCKTSCKRAGASAPSRCSAIGRPGDSRR